MPGQHYKLNVFPVHCVSSSLVQYNLSIGTHCILEIQSLFTISSEELLFGGPENPRCLTAFSLASACRAQLDQLPLFVHGRVCNDGPKSCDVLTYLLTDTFPRSSLLDVVI